MEFNNWKLKEVKDFVEIVAEESIVQRDIIVNELNLPVNKDKDSGLYRSDTFINWYRMPRYYKFFFDTEGWEKKIEKWFRESELGRTEKIIVTYGWEEPMVKIPTKLFFEDWEGFIRSTLWETIIFSEDFKLIMEVSRDYYLHSNFEIAPNSFAER